MALRWTDVHAIGELLYDQFPEFDPLTVRFTELMKWIVALEEFEDDPDRCGERVLEAIQMAWLSEWKEDH